MSRNALQVDHVDWQVPIRYYSKDELEPAFQSTRELGTGLAGRYLRWYRLIEAEYLTRVQSDIHELEPWGKVEIVRGLGEDGAWRRPIDNACREVCGRLDWKPSVQTLFTFMAPETDAPWTIGRAGFHITKEPYDKVCLPHYLLFDERQLYRTAVHEYAHVTSSHLSEGRVPRWLNEAISMALEYDYDRHVRNGFASGNLPWLSPAELDGAFMVEDDGAYTSQKMWLAYQQSAAIGMYLQSLGGIESLGKLLRGFSNNSFLTNVVINLKGENPSVEAISEVYGLSLEELFQQTLTFLRRATPGR